MKQTTFLKIFFCFTVFLFFEKKVVAQSISGVGGNYNCVFPGNSCTYQISDYDYGGNVNDKWCISGGTINGGTDSCIINSGSSIISITWTGNVQNGTISYFKPANSSTPTAKIFVTILKNGNINYGSNSLISPYIPLGIPIVLPLVGDDANICSVGMIYQWQKSEDGRRYFDIPGATQKDFTVTGTYLHNVYFRRNVFSNNESGSVFGVSMIALFVQ